MIGLTIDILYTLDSCVSTSVCEVVFQTILGGCSNWGKSAAKEKLVQRKTQNTSPLSTCSKSSIPSWKRGASCYAFTKRTKKTKRTKVQTTKTVMKRRSRLCLRSKRARTRPCWQSWGRWCQKYRQSKSHFSKTVTESSHCSTKIARRCRLLTVDTLLE